MPIVPELKHAYITRDSYESQIAQIKDYITASLGVVESVHVRVDHTKPSRRSIQNRLAHRWKAEIGNHMGMDLNDVWSMLKYDYLLPLKLSDEKEYERAVFEMQVIDAAVDMLIIRDETLSKRELTLSVAFDTIRSNNISVKLFSQWLRVVRHAASEQGIYLTTREDELNYER